MRGAVTGAGLEPALLLPDDPKQEAGSSGLPSATRSSAPRLLHSGPESLDASFRRARCSCARKC